MRRDPSLNLTVADFGLGAGIFFAGYGAMQVPALQVIQHVGARPVLGILLIAWGTVASAIGAITSRWQLYILRFVLGLFEAGYYPGALYYLSTWLPDEVAGMAAALLTMTGAIFGSSVGNLTAGLILSSTAFDGWLRLPAWRWLFFLQGPPAVVVGLIFLLLQPTTLGAAQWLAPSDRQALLDRLQRGAQRDAQQPPAGLAAADATASAADSVASAADSAAESTLVPLADGDANEAAAGRAAEARPPPPVPVALSTAVWRLVRLPTTWLFAAYHFANATLAYTGLFFIPLLYSELLPSWLPWQIAALVTGPQLVSAVYSGWVASFTDRSPEPTARRQRRLLFALLSPIVGGAFSILGAVVLLSETHVPPLHVSHFNLSAAALIIMAIGATLTAGSIGPFWSLHHDVQPPALGGASIAFVNALGNLGGFVGPYSLAALKASLGPPCSLSPNATAAATATTIAASSKRNGCVASWAGGLMAVSSMTMAILLSVAAVVLWKKHRLLR